jgi:protease-4
LIGIAAAIGGSEDKTALKENTVLKLDLNHPIVENVAEDENPLKNLGPFADNSDEIGLVQIREALKRAAVDTHIKGISLQAHYPMGGYAQLQEIRDALLAFKKSGSLSMLTESLLPKKAITLLRWQTKSS